MFCLQPLRPSKNLFFDGKGFRSAELSEYAFGKMNSPKTLKFQSFRSAKRLFSEKNERLRFFGKLRLRHFVRILFMVIRRQ